jgi:hypothetical protein
MVTPSAKSKTTQFNVITTSEGIVSGGMIFVNSGYGGIAARPGNVFLAFGVE